MEADKIYKTAVIGCGRIGSLFDLDDKRKIISSHCGAYNAHKSTKLVSVCDIDINKAASCSDQWKVGNYYSDFKKMLDNEKIDILSICTHPYSHHEIIDFAVKYDLKAIFCEKPISHSIASANQIVKLCKENDVYLAINHFRRWDKFFVSFRDKLLNNEFGTIQHINFYYTRGISNTGSHLFDLLRFLFGDISSIKSISSIEELNDDPTLSCIIELDNGKFCNLIGLDGRYYRIFDLEIFTSKYKILIDTSKKIRLYKSEPSKRSSEFNELYEFTSNQKENKNNQIFLNTISNIIESIENKIPINCTGIDGKNSLELIIASKVSNVAKKKVLLPVKDEYLNISI